MVADRQVLGELMRRERVAALGRFMGGLCHELANPLAFVLSNSENLAEYAADLTRLIRAYRGRLEGAGLVDPELERLERDIDVEFLLEDAVRAAEEASQGARRLRELIAAVRTYAAVDEGPIGAVDLGKATEQAMAILTKALRGRVEVDLDLPPGISVRGRATDLQQIIVALLTNALDASATRVTVRVEQRESTIALVVADDGPGVPCEVAAHVFEPFFTTRPGDSLGLGLAVARRLAESMGGTLVLQQAKVGARFALVLGRA